jgi:undecaprenyl pyrophosphate synthase
MSTEEFLRQVQEGHKEDIEAIEKLLDILKDLQEQETRVYDFYVTSNL